MRGITGGIIMNPLNRSKLKRLVNCYRSKSCTCCKEEIKFYKKQNNLIDVIKKAAIGETVTGKMHDHQHMIGVKKSRRFAIKLSKNINNIRHCTTFDSLMDVVENCKTERIGSVAIYDTAFRIGVFLGIYPKKIYLHRGTKIGAQNLFGKKKIRGRSYLEKHELPKELQCLQAWELENFLCDMNDELV